MGISKTKIGQEIGKMFAETRSALGHDSPKKSLVKSKKTRTEKLNQVDGKIDALKMRKALGVSEVDYQKIVSSGAHYVAKDLKHAERLYDRACEAMGPSAALLPNSHDLRDNYIERAARSGASQQTTAQVHKIAAERLDHAVAASGLTGQQRKLVTGLGASLLGRLAFDHEAGFTVDRPKVAASDLVEQQRARKNSASRYLDKKVEKLKVNLETAGQHIQRAGVKLQYAGEKAVRHSRNAAATSLAGTAVGLATTTVIAASPVVATTMVGMTVGQGIGTGLKAAAREIGKNIRRDTQAAADLFRAPPPKKSR